VFTIFPFFPTALPASPYMRKQAVQDERTPAQRKAAELKNEMARKKRNRRKEAKRRNLGNQWN
jgi:hypothetical protein